MFGKYDSYDSSSDGEPEYYGDLTVQKLSLKTQFEQTSLSTERADAEASKFISGILKTAFRRKNLLKFITRETDKFGCTVLHKLVMEVEMFRPMVFTTILEFALDHKILEPVLAVEINVQYREGIRSCNVRKLAVREENLQAVAIIDKLLAKEIEVLPLPSKRRPKTAGERLTDAEKWLADKERELAKKRDSVPEIEVGTDELYAKAPGSGLQREADLLSQEITTTSSRRKRPRGPEVAILDESELKRRRIDISDLCSDWSDSREEIESLQGIEELHSPTDGRQFSKKTHSWKKMLLAKDQEASPTKTGRDR